MSHSIYNNINNCNEIAVKNRIMIAGTNSGCGKTTVTIGIVKALADRGYDVSSFKCGPDYIDPMFHRNIIGVNARNLDSFFCDDKKICELILEYGREMTVIEGVMGFYDGVGEKGSSMEVSEITKTPVILVVNCRGMSDSIGAVLQGFVGYKKNRICGAVFNRLPESLVDSVKKMCEKLDIKYLGRLPYKRELEIDSRHLGLVTADEVCDLKEKVMLLSKTCEENILLDEIIEISKNAGRLVSESSESNEYSESRENSENNESSEYSEYSKEPETKISDEPVIAVARDEAFCFLYQDNIDYLEKKGCIIKYFSPLNDHEIPRNAKGLILPGGYPELYADRLSENKEMLESIKRAVSLIPVIAECGGFMYLHEKLVNKDGREYPLAGVIKGSVFEKEKLVRFGYVTLSPKSKKVFGKECDSLTAHEFHYWESSNCGQDFEAQKKSNGLKYYTGFENENLYAGFPHIYFYGNEKFADNFIDRCRGSV